MRRISLSRTAALGAVLMMAALPGAMAQTYRDDAPPPARYGPGRMGAGKPADQGMGGEEWQGPARLLRQADAAVARGQLPLASQLLEQAETRLLSRSIDARENFSAAVGGATAEIANARQALAKGDRIEAHQRIRMAMEALERGGGGSDMPDDGTTIIVPGGPQGGTVFVR